MTAQALTLPEGAWMDVGAPDDVDDAAALEQLGRDEADPAPLAVPSLAVVDCGTVSFL